MYLSIRLFPLKEIIKDRREAPIILKVFYISFTIFVKFMEHFPFIFLYSFSWSILFSLLKEFEPVIHEAAILVANNKWK